MRVTVIGHTDNTGSDTINNPLSVRRAEAVRDYMAGKGVNPTRVAHRRPRLARAGGRQRQRDRARAEPPRRDLPARAGQAGRLLKRGVIGWRYAPAHAPPAPPTRSPTTAGKAGWFRASAAGDAQWRRCGMRSRSCCATTRACGRRSWSRRTSKAITAKACAAPRVPRPGARPGDRRAGFRRDRRRRHPLGLPRVLQAGGRRL